MKEILTTLFRRKRAFLTFFACMVIIPMILAYILPSSYLGKSTLLLTTSRFKKPFLPDERDARSSYMQVSMEDVGSEVELLTSYPVLAKVVDENHLDRNDPPPSSKLLKWCAYWIFQGIHNSLVTIGLKPNTPPREAAIEDLRRKVNVDFVKRTNIITVKLKKSSPELARDIVNSLVEAYLLHHIKVHGNAYVLETVKKEMELSAARLRTAEDSLNKFSKENSISDVETQRHSLLEKLSDAENKIQLLENANHKNLSPDVYGSLSEDPAIAELSKKLTDAEMRRIELTTRYAGDDRKSIASKQEIEELKNLIQQRSNRSLNTWKSLAFTYRLQLSKLDHFKINIDRLKQDIEDLDRIFQLNREKTDEILISQAMDKAAIAGARVVEYAVADATPVFPKRIPILIISIFFGFVFGAVYVISLDKLSLKVLTVADVEHTSKLPVLASLPEYSLKEGADQNSSAMQLARDLIPLGNSLFRNNMQVNEPSMLHTLLLTSPSNEAGTTFLCDNLARLISPNGQTVVLTFTYGDPLPKQADLSSACSSNFPLNQYMEKDEVGVLHLCLAVSPKQLSLYDNPMRKLLAALHQNGAQYILIDASSQRGDSLYLKFVPVVEKVILVAAYNITSKPALSRMSDLIKRHQGNLIGCLFNRRQDVIPEFLYQRLF